MKTFRRFSRFTLLVAAVVGTLGVGGAAYGALSTNQKLLIKNAVHDADLGAWLSALADMWVAQPSGFSAYNFDAKSANVVKFHFKLKDNGATGRVGGATAAQVGKVTLSYCYLSDSSTGNGKTATPGTSAMAGVSGSGAVMSVVSGVSAEVISPSTGWTTISLTNTGTAASYVCCTMPDESVACTTSFAQ